jgi:Ca-activated chloride channel family protein
MQRENRLELVKRALHLLLDEMRSDDRVGLVVYGSDARVVLPHVSLRERGRIERAIDGLVPEGSTNAAAGLRQGYALADEAFHPGWINRILLCSDGVANTGSTAAEEILARIGSEARRGIELSTIGFGMGNYNDVLMEKLADQGDGSYHYVDDLDEARRVFVEGLTGTLQSIARQVKVQVAFDPETVRRYRLLGYENRDVADRDFRNDRVDAGEVGAGHEVTALFEVSLEDAASGEGLAEVRLRYEEPDGGRVVEMATALGLDDVARRFDASTSSFQLDAAVAEFAEILRKSYWAKEGSLAEVARVARSAARDGADPGSAQELLGLVESARRLWPGSPAPPAEENEDDE